MPASPDADGVCCHEIAQLCRLALHKAC
jgi:hypothetical protein